jgi:hypothetical protein
VVIDGHFTDFIISCTKRHELYEELKKLHSLVSNEVVRCEVLESIRGWLVQLKKSEEVAHVSICAGTCSHFCINLPPPHVNYMCRHQ